jgi:pre-mRNA-splicing factor ATP-dependent RNA helicase DHX15/PRP43
MTDTGLCKEAGYNPRAAVNTLVSALISQASARQRAGRAGRTQPGMCFRLYSEDTFNNVFPRSNAPGILTATITPEILLLKAAGYKGLGQFDFIDPPHPEPYLRALQELTAL